MTILDELAEYAMIRVEKSKKNKSLEEIQKEALSIKKGEFEFETAIRKKSEENDIAFICECKKASPSKGIISNDFDYLKIAKEYELAGADCISVLTEPKWFLGSDAYLKDISSNVSIPCIRKDFVVDEYMIYEAKLLGASAVLLIVSILEDEQIKKYIEICDVLGLSALVETHDEEELKRAINCNARIIGVNNRNLKDFSVDTQNSKRLINLIPEDVLFVSESGVKTAEDIGNIKAMGADAVLIGETLMRADDKKEKLDELKGRI